MLILAIILLAVAVVVFALEALRPATVANALAIGLAFLGGGVLAYVLYVANSVGKF